MKDPNFDDNDEKAKFFFIRVAHSLISQIKESTTYYVIQRVEDGEMKKQLQTSYPESELLYYNNAAILDEKSLDGRKEGEEFDKIIKVREREVEAFGTLKKTFSTLVDRSIDAPISLMSNTLHEGSKFLNKLKNNLPFQKKSEDIKFITKIIEEETSKLQNVFADVQELLEPVFASDKFIKALDDYWNAVYDTDDVKNRNIAALSSYLASTSINVFVDI